MKTFSAPSLQKTHYLSRTSRVLILQVGHFIPLHMDEFCLMMFHTALSSTVLQTNSMSKKKEKRKKDTNKICLDGRMKKNPEPLPSTILVIHFAVHLDLLSSSIRTQGLTSVQSDRRTHRQWGPK